VVGLDSANWRQRSTDRTTARLPGQFQSCSVINWIRRSGLGGDEHANQIATSRELEVPGCELSALLLLVKGQIWGPNLSLPHILDEIYSSSSCTQSSLIQAVTCISSTVGTSYWTTEGPSDQIIPPVYLRHFRTNSQHHSMFMFLDWILLRTCFSALADTIYCRAWKVLIAFNVKSLQYAISKSAHHLSNLQPIQIHRHVVVALSSPVPPSPILFPL
jgi:hypothetical protein